MDRVVSESPAEPAYRCMQVKNRDVCTSSGVNWSDEPTLCFDAANENAATIERKLNILGEVLKLR